MAPRLLVWHAQTLEKPHWITQSQTWACGQGDKRTKWPRSTNPNAEVVTDILMHIGDSEVWPPHINPKTEHDEFLSDRHPVFGLRFGET